MSVGEAVVDRLVELGVDTVFGIPGKQTLPLNEALDGRDDAEFVVARHETAVTHQAWGYAETTSPGELAATAVVPGPGDMNAMNGLKNALNDCVPMVHIAVETEADVRGGDGIHETPPDTYDNVVKENYLVETAEGAVATIEEAVRVAREAPMGPVRVGIPKDVLASDATQAVAGDAPPSSPPEPDEETVADVATLLGDADDPVVLAGGGVRRAAASDDLVAAAEAFDAPVVTTYKGKGTIPEDHPLSAGVLCGAASTELRSLLADSDAALVVGSDLDAVATGQWSVALPDDLVHVTLDPDDVGFGYEPAIGVVADAGATLAKLASVGDGSEVANGSEVADGSEVANGSEVADGSSVADSAGAARASSVREADADRFRSLIDQRKERPLTSVETLQTLREHLPRETVVGVDAGGFRLWTLVSFAAFDSRSYVNPGSWATMGTGLPSAIGAKLGNPDSEVVALTGDGGLMMCVHELHTLAAAELDVTVILLNNQDYAIISEEAERSYGLDPGAYGWADAPIDFVDVASGMGLDARRVQGREEIAPAVDAARDVDGPALVEIVTDPYEPQASEWMRE